LYDFRRRSRCTGKERDAETGLDFFGARYFSAAQGRFTSPDWSASPEPVPYADLGDPQSLNRYAYVRNNPLSRTDLSGHADDPCKKSKADTCVVVTADADQPPFYMAAVAAGHHFVDQAVVKGKDAWNSLAGQYFRRWFTGGPLNPGAHTGFPKLARLSQDQIRAIVEKVETETGRSMRQWTSEDIMKCVDEVRKAEGSTGKFLADIAEENPTARTVGADVKAVMAAAQDAMRTFQSSPTVQAVEGTIETVVEDVDEACAGGPACIP
jgi:RHS repeat-associated protein